MRPPLPRPGTVRRLLNTYTVNGQDWELTPAGWQLVSPDLLWVEPAPISFQTPATRSTA